LLVGQKGPGGKRVVVVNVTKMPVQGITKTPVSGVGEYTLSVATPGFGIGLIFRKGASAFDVPVYGFPFDRENAGTRPHRETLTIVEI
jgi:hypothetical protein